MVEPRERCEEHWAAGWIGMDAMANSELRLDWDAFTCWVPIGKER